MFEISPLNPIRMIPLIEWDRDMYQTVPFDKASLQESKRAYQKDTGRMYYQKFITRDAPVMQIITNYTDVICQLRTCCSNGDGCVPIVLLDIEVVDTESQLTGVVASCLEAKVDFSLITNEQIELFPDRRYELYISALDENEELVEWISEPIQVGESWPNTMCVEYTHSRNDWMVFQHVQDDSEPWKGLVRIESDLIEFKPSSVDTIYPDQVYNVTNVDTIPFRQFTWDIGGNGEPLPDWRVDQVNRIIGCDQVKIDSQFYTKSEGAQWEENRVKDSPFSEQKIILSESENRFQYQLDTSGLTEEMMAVQKTIDLFNNTTEVTISNKFKKFIRHEFISIFNPNEETFVLTIAATSMDGINDMPAQSFTINGELTKDITWVWLFDRPKTYTITGIDGILLNIIIGYKKLDALPSDSPSLISGGRIRNVSMYHGTPTEFALDFDPLTGLGVEGGAYEGCAVCNGNNGTPNLLDRMIIATDGLTDIAEKPANQSGGSWLKQILIGDLPVLSFKIFAAHLPGSPPPLPSTFTQIDADGYASPDGRGLSPDDFYRINKAAGATTATLGNTNSIGGINGDGTGGVGDTFNVQGKYYRLIFWKQIS